MIRPPISDWHPLFNFLSRCEAAAKPPEPTTTPISTFLKPFSLVSHNLLAPPPHMATLADVMEGKPPFDAPESLPANRAARLVLLQQWMERFPAFQWLAHQPCVTAALKSFRHRQKRKGNGPRLTDDLADFRFWYVAVAAAWLSEWVSQPPLKADQRDKAVKAAKFLESLLNTTSLRDQAGLDWQDVTRFRRTLERVRGISNIARSTRHDKYKADRDYVRMLAEQCWHSFEDTIPSMLCNLAGLRLKNPDLRVITGLVTQRRQELRLDYQQRLAQALRQGERTA